MKNLYILVLTAITIGLHAQTANDESIFTVKAKALPLQLYPAIDTLTQNQQSRFFVLLPKGVELDNVVFTSGSLSKQGDTIWIIPRTTGNMVLSAYTHNKTTKQVYRKVFHIQPNEGLSGGISMNGAGIPVDQVIIPERQPKQLRCFVNGVRIDTFAQLSERFFTDTVIKYGFELRDEQNGRQPYFGLALTDDLQNEGMFVQKEVFDTVFSEALAGRIRTYCNFTTCRFQFNTDSDNYFINFVVSKPVEFEIGMDEQVLKDGNALSYKDLQNRLHKGFHLIEARRPGTKYSIGRIEVYLSSNSKKEKRINLNQAEVTQYLLDELKKLKSASIRMKFVLAAEYTDKKGLHKVKDAKELTLNYVKKKQKERRSERPPTANLTARR